MSQYADRARRYHLDSVIATGGMGVVWRGTDTRLDRPVAVKVLKAEYADDPLFRTRFEGEARSAAALHHPGIAGVYDYGADDTGELPPYLVMELVDGQPLSTLLATARSNGRVIDTAVVQDLLAQAADALGVAHRAGIVHRDVKPANLLVTPDRRVKITDFGIARAADAAALTRTGSVMGTPQYLSPEQARGNPSTPASDVYSLGVVAFECLTGRRPFEAETPVATALAHLQQPVPELPDSVPAPLAAVVRRALAKDPAERFPDGTAFGAALRDPSSASAAAAAAGPATPAEGATQVLPATGVLPPTPAGPATPMERLDSPSPYAGEEEKEQRRSPWPIAAAVILLVVAAVVAAILLLGGDDEDPVADDPTSEPTTEATTEETTTEAATVEFDADDYVCSQDYRVAQSDLDELGLRTSVERFSTPNDGSCPADSVAEFSRSGTLTEGARVVIYYWGPVEQEEEPTPTPEPTPTETTEAPTTPTETTEAPTTEPTDPLTDLGEDG
ncbi:serine/threonine-protein kinase [Nocardioides sp. J54]|uniref:serine/threonine-protein kinase n=1 Tax=Nocardioides sp. J54 TaxID=935866 RepID=UPI0004B762BE|nr:serine/threonine-protein kinase [Nocardioides sp. J54]